MKPGRFSQGGVAQLTYAYDAMGRRISKTVGSGTPTQYLYDGANGVQETQGSSVNPILVGLGVDERFARNDVTGRTYFLSDAINSTIGLTNSSGTIQNTYSYDPYGNTTQSNASFTNSYQYTGREADTPRLSYYRARYYSPMMGGFISEDPLGFGGGQPSFYAYVGGDPLSYIDPMGLNPFMSALDAIGYDTKCKRDALGKFLLNMTPILGTGISVWNMLNGDGGAGELFDSSGTTADQAGDALGRAAASGRAQAAALRKAGMYNAQQNLLNATANADRDVGELLSKTGTVFAAVSWGFNIYDFQ